MFDEIGEVEGWQNLIYGLRVAYDCDIYITWSNENLLSWELATYLLGRYVSIKISPLPFLEFKVINNKFNNDILMKEYINYGGCPVVSLIKETEMKKEVIKGIYDNLILKDVFYKGNIINVEVLIRLSIYLLDNIGNTISSTKITNYFISSGLKVKPDTINKYLDLLESAFTFYKANRYDIRGKERLKTLGKYYVVDNGLRIVVLGRLNTNVGSIIENLVFLKLKQSNYEVFVGKYDDYEIDFVCFKDEFVKYIQVAVTIPSNNDREIKNLLNLKNNYDRIIVTNNHNDVGIVDGIKIIHLNDFLLLDI